MASGKSIGTSAYFVVPFGETFSVGRGKPTRTGSLAPRTKSFNSHREVSSPSSVGGMYDTTGSDSSAWSPALDGAVVVVWPETTTVVETAAVVVGATVIVVGPTEVVAGASVTPLSSVSDKSWVAEVHAAEKPRTITTESQRIPTQYRWVIPIAPEGVLPQQPNHASLLAPVEASDHGADSRCHALRCGRYRARALLQTKSFHLVGQPRKGTPTPNGEDQRSHLHPKELRRWNVELGRPTARARRHRLCN